MIQVCKVDVAESIKYFKFCKVWVRFLESHELYHNVVRATQMVFKRNEVANRNINEVKVGKKVDGSWLPQYLSVCLFATKIERCKFLIAIDLVHMSS